MDYDLPDYPYDLEELKIIDRLILKIPEYQKKISGLYTEIDKLTKHMVSSGSFSMKQDLDFLIYKAFFIELENRPYNIKDSDVISRLRAENHHYGRIKNRNISCEICGENRTIDKCHIIPERIGGTKSSPNLLYLCPTHHRLFDQFKLSQQEWAQIDWDRKAEESKAYALKDTFKYQMDFWRKQGEDCWDHDLYPETEDDLEFIEYIANKILLLFTPGRPIPKKNIQKMLGENIHYLAKNMVKVFIKHKLIIPIGKGKLVLGKDNIILSKEILEDFSYH